MSIRNLDKALSPSSVAMIGASPQKGSAGYQIVRNLLAGGFAGTLQFVNPRYKTLEQRPCYPNVGALPTPPDLAVIATPPHTVPKLVSEIGASGTRTAVVITAGVNEENGLRQAMLDAARPYGVRILGPNCLGLLVPEIGLNASFAHTSPKSGKLAFLSQSGALVGAVLDWAAEERIGFSLVASMGDMADVDVGDLLDYLAGDTQTRAILLYLETIPSPRKFMSAARAAARAKPVVVVKSGRHARAALAAATHTGALAGSDTVANAAFHRAGLLRVNGLEDLFVAAEALTHSEPMQGGKLAIITNGGGAGVLAVDRLLDFGGELAKLSKETIGRLDAQLPPTWSKSNPVDIIGDAGPERYESALHAVLDDESVDAVLVINCPTALASSLDAAEAVLRVVAARWTEKCRSKPMLANWLGDGAAQPARERFAHAGVPCYGSPDDAIRSFTYLTTYCAAQEALMRTPPSLPAGFAVNREAAAAVIKRSARNGISMLSEIDAKLVLDAYGIATVPTEIARNPNEVESIARTQLASHEAVVVKVLSNDITHKSDIGGVRLGLSRPKHARAAAVEITANVHSLRPDAHIIGFSVQPMVKKPRAHELIIGVADDELFGPVIMFGAGGTAVEVLSDQAVALPPLDLKLAREVISKTRIFHLLKGYRDRAAANLDEIALSLVRVSHLVADVPAIRELDINPVLVDEHDVIALDARIQIETKDADLIAPNPRLAIRPYPMEWAKTEELPNGQLIHIRPVKPSDERYYAEFLKKLDATDIRLRFVDLRTDFPHEFIARFTQIDYARAMAFIVLDAEQRHMWGVARFATGPEQVRGEIGIIVRTDLKGQGIGRALMMHLIDYARSDGLHELYGSVLAENHQALSFCRKLGFSISRDSSDPTVHNVLLRLNEVGGSATGPNLPRRNGRSQ